MTKTIIGPNGITTSAGGSGLIVTTDVDFRQPVVGVAPFGSGSENKAVTSAFTLSQRNAGVVTVSGSGAAITVTMPVASAVGGSTFILRSLSDHAHVLTGSQETNGTLVFTDGTDNGSSLALNPLVGSSVALICDGNSFLVAANSGSVTISGT